MCDAGEPNQLSETIGNLGLWTRLGIQTKATRLETHHLVRFLFVVPCPVGFCAWRATRAGYYLVLRRVVFFAFS